MNDNVRRRIAENNEWYVGDQHAAQLGTPGGRWALGFRWRLFADAIDMWLARGAQVARPLRALDAGCGDGINFSVLKNIFDRRRLEARIAGCDYNSLRLARADDGGCYPVVEADLRRLPFAAGSFDVVLCSHVLEHIHEDVAAMRELARVVTRTGLVVVAVPNEGCAAARLRNHVIQRAILRKTDHVHFYTADILIGRLARAGLRPITPVFREGLFVPHLGVYTLLRERAAGRALIRALARVAPSQAAGLVVGLERAEQ